MAARHFPPVDAPQPVALLNADLGPKMRALNDRQRRFVDALLIQPGNFTAAAEAAGYKAESRNSLMVQAGRLAHSQNIIEAIHEEAVRRGQAAVLSAMSNMVKMAEDPVHKDHFQATKFVLGINGIGVTTEHHVKVEQKDDAAKMREIRQMAEFLAGQGVQLDLDALLGLPKTLENQTETDDAEWVSE